MLKEILRKEAFKLRKINCNSNKESVEKLVSKESKKYIDSLLKEKKDYELCFYSARDSEISISSIFKDYKKYYIPSFENTLTKSVFHLYAQEENEKIVKIEELIETLIEKGRSLIIIVPSLLLDIEKNRLGRGRGWYDFFLKSLSDNNIESKTISFVYENEILPLLPKKNHDVAIDEAYFIRNNEKKLSIHSFKEIELLNIQRHKHNDTK